MAQGSLGHGRAIFGIGSGLALSLAVWKQGQLIMALGRSRPEVFYAHLPNQ